MTHDTKGQGADAAVRPCETLVRDSIGLSRFKRFRSNLTNLDHRQPPIRKCWDHPGVIPIAGVPVGRRRKWEGAHALGKPTPALSEQLVGPGVPSSMRWVAPRAAPAKRGSDAQLCPSGEGAKTVARRCPVGRRLLGSGSELSKGGSGCPHAGVRHGSEI